MQDRMRDKEEILSENENLKAQIDSLTEQNNKLIQDQTEYVRLQQMYNLDQQYTEYSKIAAEIISKDPGNWYDTFMINRDLQTAFVWIIMYLQIKVWSGS